MKEKRWGKGRGGTGVNERGVGGVPTQGSMTPGSRPIGTRVCQGERRESNTVKVAWVPWGKKRKRGGRHPEEQRQGPVGLSLLSFLGEDFIRINATCLAFGERGAKKEGTRKEGRRTRWKKSRLTTLGGRKGGRAKRRHAARGRKEREKNSEKKL